MDKKIKLDVASDNLAMPEVHVTEDDMTDGVANSANLSPEDEEEETDVVYENLAMPEYHIKKHPKQ